MKKCSKCALEKDESDFYKIAATKNKRQSQCKDCMIIGSLKHYASHKEERIKYAINYIKNLRISDPKGFWARGTIKGHNSIGRPCNFTAEQLIPLIPNTCDICGIVFIWDNVGVKRTSPTLDRINNDTIVTLENIQFLCHKCNSMKQECTQLELEAWCQMVLNKRDRDANKTVKP